MDRNFSRIISTNSCRVVKLAIIIIMQLCMYIISYKILYVSLSAVVLNSRDRYENVRMASEKYAP